MIKAQANISFVIQTNLATRATPITIPKKLINFLRNPFFSPTLIPKFDVGIYLIYKERYKESAEIQQIETVIEKEVNILKTWQKVLMWLGALAILWILIKILLKIQFSV